MSGTRERILLDVEMAIAVAGRDGLGLNAIRRAVKGTAATKDSALKELEADGKIVRGLDKRYRAATWGVFPPPPVWPDESPTDKFDPVPDRTYVDTTPEPIAPSTDLKTWLIWPDVHCPFESKPAVDLVLRVARTIKPHGQVIIGDFADMLSTSRHPKTPHQTRWQFKDEIEYTNKRLDDLDAIGCVEKHYCLGNHETNPQRFAMKEALGLFDTLDPRHLFRLQERGWKTHGYQIPVKIGKIWFVHDTGFAGVNAAKQNGDAFQASTVQGHVHSAHVAYFGSALGEQHVSATIGWLGDPAAAEYMTHIKKTRHWMHAFGLMRVEPGGNSHFQVIPIIEGRCVVDGVLYQ